MTGQVRHFLLNYNNSFGKYLSVSEENVQNSIKVQIRLWSKILVFPVIIYFHMAELLVAVYTRKKTFSSQICLKTFSMFHNNGIQYLTSYNNTN